MIYRFLLLLSLLFFYFAYATAQENNGVAAKRIKSDNITEEGIIAPQFEGGDTALYEFLENNIKYPLLLVDIEMEGETQVKFKVDKEGSVKNIELLRGFDPLADDRVVHVLEVMPRWIPGSVNGSTTDMPVELNISFALTDDLRNFVKTQKEEGISLEELDKEFNSKQKQTVASLKEEEEDISISKLDTINNKAPQFPGGEKGLEEYFKKNLKYPKKAIEKKLEGRVVFTITVSAQGEITDIILHRGFHYECNQEAYYLIKKMPDWIPGLKDGKPVSMQVILPITFTLPSQPSNSPN